MRPDRPSAAPGPPPLGYAGHRWAPRCPGRASLPAHRASRLRPGSRRTPGYRRRSNPLRRRGTTPQRRARHPPALPRSVAWYETRDRACPAGVAMPACRARHGAGNRSARRPTGWSPPQYRCRFCPPSPGTGGPHARSWSRPCDRRCHRAPARPAHGRPWPRRQGGDRADACSPRRRPRWTPTGRTANAVRPVPGPRRWAPRRPGP